MTDSDASDGSRGGGPHAQVLDKAYNDPAFIHGRDGRALRMLSEYLAPEARFRAQGVHDTVVFFGSARFIPRDRAERELADAKAHAGDVAAAEQRLQGSACYEDARELARRLTEWSLNLSGHEGRFVVCTGGGPGIMEAANRGAHEAGGKSVGLSISIPKEEFGNPYVTDGLGMCFHYFFMRKFWFTYLAKAVIVMPGGFGTLDELFEVMTLIQTLKMKKRLPVVLFGRAFWGSVLNLDALADFGTIDRADIDLFHRVDTVDEAYAYLVGELKEHLERDTGPML